MSNSLGPNHIRRSVDPDIDPNCLQRSSSGSKSKAFRWVIGDKGTMILSLLHKNTYWVLTRSTSNINFL